MKRPGGADSFAESVTKLLKRVDHALAERRCATLGQSFADSQQCVVWKAWSLPRAVNGRWSDAHLRLLRVRGLRLFSSTRSALTRRFAKSRSVAMPWPRPYSWPLIKARATRAARAVVPATMVNGSMLFCVLCFGLGRGASESLKKEHPHKAGQAHALRVSVLAGLADDFGRERNACGFRSFVRWDFALRHR